MTITNEEVKYWFDLFTKVNKDIAVNEDEDEYEVAFSDTEFYADQIVNLSEANISYAKAKELADAMASYAE